MDEDASGVVLTAVALMAGSTIVRLVRQGKWQGNTGKVIIFAFILAVFLLAINQASPTVARVLSGLGVVGAFVLNGPYIFPTISTFAKSQPIIVGGMSGASTGHKH